VFKWIGSSVLFVSFISIYFESKEYVRVSLNKEIYFVSKHIMLWGVSIFTLLFFVFLSFVTWKLYDNIQEREGDIS
jgi:hypothetical protein